MVLHSILYIQCRYWVCSLIISKHDVCNDEGKSGTKDKMKCAIWLLYCVKSIHEECLFF